MSLRASRPSAPVPSQEVADLYLLGTGIRGIHQLTRETEDLIRQARIVLHLSGRHEALRKLNPRVHDLEDGYWTGEAYWDVYERMIREVLREVRRGPGVAFVGYGHPLLFDNVSRELARRGRARGYRVVTLPAVSCLDTLCIELDITYANGLQIYELDYLFEPGFRLNPAVDVLVLDVGHIGMDGTDRQPPDHPDRLRPLIGCLKRFYPLSHMATLVQCGDGERATRLARSQIGLLGRRRRLFVPGVTLFIPAR